MILAINLEAEKAFAFQWPSISGSSDNEDVLADKSDDETLALDNVLGTQLVKSVNNPTNAHTNPDETTPLRELCLHLTSAIQAHQGAEYLITNAAASATLKKFNKFLKEFGYNKIEKTDTAKAMFKELHKEAKSLASTAKTFRLSLQRFKFYLTHLDKKVEDIHEYAEDLNKEHEKNNTDQAQLEEVIEALKQKHAEENSKAQPDSNTLTTLGLAENRLLKGNVFDTCELLVQDALGLLTDAPGPEFLALYKKGGPDKVKIFVLCLSSNCTKPSRKLGCESVS